MTHEVLNGVAIERRSPATEEELAENSASPPLLFVHGGCHGSWCWSKWLPWFASRGWQATALNWFGRHGSRALSTSDSLARGIADVGTEIGLVRASSGQPPVLVAHSMGGLAALSYAANHEVAGLVLLTPVVPREIGAATVELDVNPDQMWGPPPPSLARHLYYSAVSDDEAERYYKLLCPESPTAVWEATRWTVSVDLERITAPALLVAAEEDALVPAGAVRALAERLNAPAVTLPNQGHGVTLDPVWSELADTIAEWLTERFGSPSTAA